MELQTSITWTLYLGEKQLSFHENLFETLHENKSGNDVTPDFDIPQLLQEVYYVDQLSKSKDYEPDEKLILQDQTFDYVRVLYNLITDLINTKYEQLIHDEEIEDIHYQNLKGLRGRNFDKYVEDNLQEPFLSRNKAYKIFKMLPNKYKTKSQKCTQRNVISKSDSFKRYWDNGVLSLASMQNDIYKDELGTLFELLEELDNNKKLKKYYEKKKTGGCFSKTEVIKNGVREDILCFSGVKFKESIDKAIDKIAESGHFLTDHAIKTSQNVRYYVCPEQYITYSEAVLSEEEFFNRMFSCCERKTFAEYDWQGVTSYTMIVKYPPCELCQFPVWEHSKKYNGRLNHEIKHKRTERKIKYDAIARIIYNKVHHPKSHL